MDGTLVDTEPYWMAAETALVESFGGTWTHEDGLTLVGGALMTSAGILRERGVALDNEAIVAWLGQRVLSQVQARLTWRPGAAELLRAMRDAGIATVLVTSSPRILADGVVGAIDFDAFDFVISAEDVALNKPHPDPYLRAAALVGVAIENCIVIEDSTPGIAAAVTSGAVTIGVPLHNPLFEGRGYDIWPTLAGRTVADLATVFSSHRAPAARPDSVPPEPKDRA
jgi:HAD superfamily hydrolase (TIGR01509 family)